MAPSKNTAKTQGGRKKPPPPPPAAAAAAATNTKMTPEINTPPKRTRGGREKPPAFKSTKPVIAKKTKSKPVKASVVEPEANPKPKSFIIKFRINPHPKQKTPEELKDEELARLRYTNLKKDEEITTLRTSLSRFQKELTFLQADIKFLQAERLRAEQANQSTEEQVPEQDPMEIEQRLEYGKYALMVLATAAGDLF